MSKQCIVFAAHSGDEIKGVGGTILRLKDAGWKIHIVYATLPEFSALGTRRTTTCCPVSQTPNHYASLVYWYYPDGKLEESISAANDNAQRVYENLEPDLVLVMNPIDAHPDHRAMAHLAMSPALQRGVNTEIMFYELCAPGRHTNDDRPQTLAHIPTHYVDTTAVIEEVAKLQNLHDPENPEAMNHGMWEVHRNRAFEYDSRMDAGMSVQTNSMEAFTRLARVDELSRELQEIFLPSPFELPRCIGVDF